MPSHWIFLSWPLQDTAPAFGGGQGFTTQVDKNMARGDSCNTSHWRLSNHTGTHIDFPRHFSLSGPNLDSYAAGFFVFQRVHLTDIAVLPADRVIRPADLNLSGVDMQTELLLVRTGEGRYRHEPRYWQNNVGFHPDVAGHLRAALPDLRVLGFDSISLSAYTQRELGRRAHAAFLNHAQPILPLEDLDLRDLESSGGIIRVVVAPLRVAGADGAPCTVMAELEG